MGKLRLTLFVLVVLFNALLCLFYIQPRRTFSIMRFKQDVPSLEHDNSTSNDSNPLSLAEETTTMSSNSTQFPLSSSSVPNNISVRLSSRPQGPQPPLTHPYNFTINPKDLCLKSGSKRLPLIIVVCSSVKNFKERQAIRDTWGSASSRSGNTGSVRLIFLVGLSLDASVTRLVSEESAKHRDVAQEDFVDSYQNLTLKSVMMLKWIGNFCPNAEFVLKTDDDMFINVPNLLRAASRLVGKKNIMFGVLFRRASPERNSSAKWYVPYSQYPGRVFPDYLSGTAYAMTSDVVNKLFKVSLTKPFLIMEDVFVTGICASTAGVKRFLVKGFSHFKRQSTGCAFKDLISGHHVSPQEMHKIWRELRSGTLHCKTRKVLRKMG